MEPSLKEAWMSALKSGEYKQSHRVLYDGNGYCCLGVLCVVAGATFEQTVQSPPYYVPKLNGVRLNSVCSLSEVTLKMFGLSEATQTWLVRLNDGCGAQQPKTFLEIAEEILHHV